MALAIKPDQKYTFADYESWPEDERWEIIEGIPYAMTAPSRLHQDIVAEVLIQVGSYLRDQPCKIYPAPFNVRLPIENEADAFIETTVEPDLSIICDSDKLDDKGCRGAPDWIIEVLSPSTTLRDMIINSSKLLQHRSGDPSIKMDWLSTNHHSFVACIIVPNRLHQIKILFGRCHNNRATIAGKHLIQRLVAPD